MDKAKRKHSEFKVIWWRFLGIWVEGTVVGLVVSYLLEWPVFSTFPHGWFVPITVVIIPGLFISLSQAIAIPKSVSTGIARWFIISMSGYVLSSFVLIPSYAQTLSRLHFEQIDLGIILYILFFYGTVVFIQWLILRHTLNKAWLWPVVTTITFVALWLLAMRIPAPNREQVFGWTIFILSVPHSLFTSLFMLWLIRQTRLNH